MSRFLFVVPPLVGHVNPLVGVAAELAERGHQIAWAGHAGLIGDLTGGSARVFECAGPGKVTRPAKLYGPAALKFLWQEFLVPLADAMAPGVTSAIEAFEPDVVVADQQAIAGGLVAGRLGRPWVTSATTSGELLDPLASMPKVDAWVTGLLDGLRTRIGDPADPGDPRFSPHGVLAFTTRDLVGPIELPHDRVHFVGPAIAVRPSTSEFPWSWLDGELPTVLVTLGTANAEAGGRFLNECADAVRARAGKLRAVLVDPLGSVGEVGDHVLVRPHVPQLELMSRLDAVVCHAGHNTVCEALWHGLPLVVAPIRDDQPLVADQVVRAGAGVRLRFARATAQHIGTAVDEVLDDARGIRANAERISRSFRAAGGVAAAATILGQLSYW
jgi:MGT family glycosyltransferase